MTTVKKSLGKSFFLAFILLLAIQIVRLIASECMLGFTDVSVYGKQVAELIAIFVLAILLVVIFKPEQPQYAMYLPKKKGLRWAYIALGLVTLVMVIIYPAFYGGYHLKLLVPLLLYGVVMPLVEQAMFQGYLWNYFEKSAQNQWVVWVLTSILFTLWRLAFADGMYYVSMESGVALETCILWQGLIGLGTGLLTGIVRLRSKSTFLGVLIQSLIALIFL